jgi:uncharacterized protein
MMWRCLDTPGHETARIQKEASDWLLTGSAVFMHQAEPCQLSYRIHCDGGWRTRKVRVSGWLGERDVDIAIMADPSGTWLLNDTACPDVEACIDVDLNFSPSTNLLPIRRLQLEVGEQATVRAAWLRFPSFRLEALEQSYCRTGPNRYRYESAGGRFTADLQVTDEGLVRDYLPAWQAVTPAEDS